jgi:tetratricopeptide (TPR) repeat protein
LWTDTFESNGTDTFAIQDEVTRGVVKGLALQFSADALSATKAGRTSDPVAHDLYKRGLEAARMSNEYGLRRSLVYFQQAVDRDPRFALAHVGLAWSHVFLADAFVPPNEAYAKAKAAAEAALAIDDRLGEAHALVAYSTFTTDWSADATALTEREFRRGLDLDPNSFNTLFLDGTYRCFEGQTDRGISEVERAGRMDPLSPLAPYLQELCNYIAKRYEAVHEAHKKTLAVDPTFAYIDSWAGAAHRELRQYDAALKEYAVAEQGLGGAPQYGLALTYIRMGRTAEARAVLARMEELARTKYVPFILRAIVYANLGELGKAAELLQQGVDRRETVMLAFKSHPEMEPLQKDPRTRQILQRVDAMRGR